MKERARLDAVLEAGAAVIAALGLAACGASDPTPGGTASDPAPEGPATPGAAAPDEAPPAGEPGNGPGTAYLDAPYATLSEYRLDDEGALVPYEVRNELFTDYADKTRGLYLPPGRTATWAGEHQPLDLPVGAILVKRFSYGARWIETRLLIRDRRGYRGHAYVWDDGHTEARLRPGGEIVAVDVTRPDGRRARATHLVPSEQQCKKCHADGDELVPIGLRPYSFDHEDQIARFTADGILIGAPAPTSEPRAPAWDDASTGDVTGRARAYLDANCGYCHSEAGAARTSGLYLRSEETDPLALGICKRPVAAGRGSGGLRFDIVPGEPDESIVIHRMRSTEPQTMMPEIGRSLAHDEAVDVVAQWIAGLPGSCR
jgi:uncharacterized repeat protein (TIGR03806 family)